MDGDCNMKQKLTKTIISFIFAAYFFAVLYITLIDRIVGEQRHMLDAPFWEYKNLLSGVDWEFYFWQIIGNLVMLIPFGAMLPFLFKKMQSAVIVAFAGCMFSAFIEITQFFTGRGLCEIDDVFNNTLGAVIGYLIFRSYTKQVNVE